MTLKIKLLILPPLRLCDFAVKKTFGLQKSLIDVQLFKILLRPLYHISSGFIDDQNAKEELNDNPVVPLER